MSIKIANDTANGNVILKGQNVAGDRTITMPNLDCELAPRMQLMTAQNSTSGTSIDFTGIPSWAKRITVMFSGVSTSGSAVKLLQLGSGVIQTTGYLAAGGYVPTAAPKSIINSTAGLPFGGVSPIDVLNGKIEVVSIENNSWVFSVSGGFSSSPACLTGGGSVALSGILDRIRITTANGTAIFNTGQINVLYEG